MKYDHLIAIDPGTSGASTLFDVGSEKPLAVFPFRGSDTIRETFGVLKGVKNTCVLIEEVSASPIMGKASCFSFGYNFGAWVECAKLIGLPVFGVRPQEWQRHIKLACSAIGQPLPEVDPSLTGDKKYRAWKNILKSLAMAYFPDEHITLDTCDAYLLGRVGTVTINAKGTPGGKLL